MAIDCVAGAWSHHPCRLFILYTVMGTQIHGQPKTVQIRNRSNRLQFRTSDRQHIHFLWGNYKAGKLNTPFLILLDYRFFSCFFFGFFLNIFSISHFVVWLFWRFFFVLFCLLLYDISRLIVIFSWIFQGAFNGWFAHYNWRCQPVNTSTGPDGIRVCVLYISEILPKKTARTVLFALCGFINIQNIIIL